VANPLDASSFVADPCASLSEAQRHEYSITSAERSTLPTGGETCYFARTPVDSLLVVFSNDPNGLNSLYTRYAHESGFHWQPTKLDGYPAVVFGEKANPDCTFAVGISDSLYFWVKASYDDETCTTSKPVASTVLANIKAAN
jgi:hypothetical protein